MHVGDYPISLFIETLRLLCKETLNISLKDEIPHGADISCSSSGLSKPTTHLTSDMGVSHHRLFSASQANIGQICSATPQNHKEIKMLVTSNIWGNSICKQKQINSNIKNKTFAFR